MLDVQGTIRSLNGLEAGGATANGLNSAALGFVFGGATTSIAGGLVNLLEAILALLGGTSATIAATGSGSFAYGESFSASTTTSILASSSGSIAMGYISTAGGSITSSGTGSIAMGYSNGILQATQRGTVAMGDDVQANAIDSDAFGANVINNSTNTFMVGFTTTPTLTVTASSVGIGTLNPFGGSLIVASGNVGIDSLTPGQALDVQGTVRMLGFSMSTGAGTGKVLTSDVNGNGTWAVGGAGSNYWTLDVGNIGINTTNNVGISTISAVNSLNILGNIGIGTISYSKYLTTAAPAGGALFEGNVGIGSLSPGQKLDVQGSIRAIGGFINGNVGIGTTFVNGTGEGALTVMNGNVGIGTWAPTAGLDVETGGNSFFNGNVGISSANPGAPLDVQGAARMTGFTLLNKWRCSRQCDGDECRWRWDMDGRFNFTHQRWCRHQLLDPRHGKCRNQYN